MKYPNRIAFLDKTSGYNNDQINLVNSFLNSLDNQFISKIMGAQKEDEYIIDTIGYDYSSLLENIKDRVYGDKAFFSATFYSPDSAAPLFKINSKYGLSNLQVICVSSDSNNYYNISNYGSITTTEYDGTNWLIWNPNDIALPVHTWLLTLCCDIDNGKNYKEATIEQNGVEYIVSSETNKSKQAYLNASFSSIKNSIYNYQGEVTEQNYGVIKETDNNGTVEIDKKPKKPFYVIGNYNSIPVFLGTCSSDGTLSVLGNMKINTANNNVRSFTFTLSNVFDAEYYRNRSSSTAEWSDITVVQSGTTYHTGTWNRRNYTKAQIVDFLSNFGITASLDRLDSSATYNFEFVSERTGTNSIFSTQTNTVEQWQVYNDYKYTLVVWAVPNYENVDKINISMKYY